MITSKQPVQKLAYLLLPLFALTGFNAQGDSHEAAPPGVVEAFMCSYNDGKDRGDLDQATSFYLKQAEKAGITPPDGYLWTLNKGVGAADIIWLNVHENLVAFGAADDANAASSDMAAVGERYDSVASCQSVLGLATTIYERETSDDDGQAAVAAWGCNFRGGAGMSAMGDLQAHIAAVNAEMGDAAPNAVYQIVPLTPGPGAPDVVVFSVSDDTSAWANGMRSLATTPAGQALGRHFNAVLDCGMSLWRGEQVVGGDG